VTTVPAEFRDPNDHYPVNLPMPPTDDSLLMALVHKSV
jgi:hypothetical protein